MKKSDKPTAKAAAPATPEALWKCWSETDDKERRAEALVDFGKQVLWQINEALNRWGEVAVIVDFEGFGDLGDSWADELTHIDGKLHDICDSMIDAFNRKPAEKTTTEERA